MTATGDRTQKVVRLLTVVVAVVVTVTLVGVAATAKPGGGKDKPESKTFVIEGTVDGFLYPGIDQVLPVVIINPINTAVSVNTVTITVGDASVACTADNVTVGDVPVPVLLGKKQQATIDVPIVLSVDSANECQGALFPIVYEGVATKR